MKSSWCKTCIPHLHRMQNHKGKVVEEIKVINVFEPERAIEVKVRVR